MDDRLDPVQIIIRPSRDVAGNPVQVVGAWIAQARRAGWAADQTDEPVDLASGARGIVEIEGLRYVIRVGRRSRSREVIVPDEHLAAHAAELVTGRRSFPSRPMFGMTAWAEPLLSPDQVPQGPGPAGT
ncbi:MAG TPA: hypothetical protein VF223_15535 [Trebonia sp.]